MDNPSIKKNVIISTLYQILLVITPLITAPYISRVIGADGIGAYSYTSSIQVYFSLFAALGTAEYGLREISRARMNVEKRSRLFWEIELVSVLTSVFILLLWGIFICFQHQYFTMYLILTLNIFNTMLDISWFFNGLEQFQYTVTKNAIVKVVGVVLILLFVKSPKDTDLYVFIMTASTLLGTMSMWLSLHKFVIKTKINLSSLKKHFRETEIYFIPTIATSIYTSMDKTLIGLITHSAAENAYYEQATKIINLVKALTFTSVNAVLGARISFLFFQEKYSEIKKNIHLSIDYVMFIGVGICFGLISISNTFVPVFFGSGWGKVVLILQLFSPQVIIIGISNCLGSQYYTPAGLRKKSAMYIIIGAIVNLILNLILIPKFASAGATFASIIAELTISILYLKNSDGYLDIKFLGHILWKKVIAGILMCLVIILYGFWNQPDIIKLFIQFLTGSLTYILTLFVLKDNSLKLFLKFLHRG
ncbi:oligosaccharide flippase family protein [Lactobacillus paragasseri]|uniref:Oligosaccharide flippase family protein n=1 Tax=Lactobacillus paragasseri TaxID=2107999 RepID=A0ABD5A0I3_9LACO|nr:oligosaccharide flippase family protein [Lactobacillus paragasseri]MDK7951757.1 oligosaccharide flippase family protein [Lactobacillus paragasseri]MDO6361322.1 oligosaccharide flippase family protein [Lactobacillus paragasseri]MDX5059572.1 oligosaccharide flippase family protein [Lactobacillus paragasseri]